MNALGAVRHTLSARLKSLRASPHTRASFLNAVCGVADYVAQPLAMLLAAPFLVHRLGLVQYGLWMLANAAVSSGGLLSTGFSDMAVRYVAMHRGRSDWNGITEVVRAALAVNLILGVVVALLLWIAAPYAALYVFAAQPELRPVFVRALDIGCAIIIARSLESVFISALRAFEKYRPAVEITVWIRITTIIVAVAFVARGGGVVSIMTVTLVATIAGALLQVIAIRQNVGPISLLPSWNTAVLRKISPFGGFTGLQALSGIIFSQADRLIVGAFLGASTVAYYSICTQVAQPIHGMVASGLHFLFPHLSARHSRTSIKSLRSAITTAFWVNTTLVLLFCLPGACFSKPILSAWMGAAFAQQTWPVLSIIAVGFGLVGMNVTGHYALLAVGAARYVTLLNLAAGATTVAAVAILLPHFGLIGAAVGRLLYGPITWLVYHKLRSLIARDEPHTATVVPAFAMSDYE